MKISRLLFLWLLIVGMLACKHSDHTRAFYYWRSKVRIDSTERKYFQALEARKLYIRLFDVDMQAGIPLPQGIVQPFEAAQLDAEYIPVVFITNRSFENSTLTNDEQLAEHVAQLIQQICDSNHIRRYKEIQIDCDWTLSTRAAYFAFLKKLKKQTGKNLSCTVRLHQLKYFEKTGIPPVDRATIMCYATSNPNEISEGNSILDLKLLKNYCARINEYPLPFDLALPLYSWAVITNHLGKIKLINGLTRTDLLRNPELEALPNGQFRARKDLVLQEMFINKDFIIRTEEIKPETIREAQRYFEQTANSPYSIIYYHLDGKFLNRFPITSL